MVIDLGILSIKVDVLIIQIINIYLLFWIIKKAFGDTIVEQIAHFRDTRKKLSEADKKLKKVLSEAELTKQEIILEWKQIKEQIITNAHQLAQHKEKEILDQAERKAKEMVNQAMVKWIQIEQEIKDNYTHLLKESAWIMIKKVFEQDPQAQEAYLKIVTDNIT